MKNVLLACQTMQGEMEQILKKQGCIFEEILWVKSGMHNVTERLRETIQNKLEEIKQADHVVLGFGACGNALAGIRAGEFELILPKMDDCISIMLGSYQRKKKIQEQGETYFMTKGWLNGESGIYQEYLFTVEKYGKEMADIIYEEILKAYRNLGVIHTGVCTPEKLMEDTAVIAKDLHLRQLSIEGDLSFLERLITGQWEGPEFLHILPYQEITMDMFF